ncbi:MAG: hypothetical protein QGH45_16890 [Myxococcota bacterium]|jgi:hypothetical protein|nr:hypothetical protein [Myxococcota bacterium]
MASKEHATDDANGTTTGPTRWANFDGLRLPVPADWTPVPRTSRSSSRLLEIQVADETSLLVLPRLSPAAHEWSLSSFLTELIEGHVVGREIVQREPDPPILGRTDEGIDFATQRAISRSPLGDPWFATYWVLVVDETSIQSVIGLSNRPEAFDDLLAAIGDVIDGAQFSEV